MKQEKSCLVHCWCSTGDGPAWIGIRVIIKAYHVAENETKHPYFSILIASVDSHPEALFQMTSSLLGKGDLESCAEELA